MAINTYESTGYTIEVKITLGLGKDKITLDVSKYTTNISYTFTVISS